MKIEVRRGAGLVLFEERRRLCGNGGEERKFGGGWGERYAGRAGKIDSEAGVTWSGIGQFRSYSNSLRLYSASSPYRN